MSINVEETYVGDPGPSDSYDSSDGGGSGGDGYTSDDGWAEGADGGGSGGDASGGPPPFTPSASALASPMSSLLTPVLCRACDAGGGGGGGPSTTPPRPPTSFTISDVLTLAPASVTLTAEPSTWSIVGSHTNFYTAATKHSASGSVLGHPVTVTFTPITYRWDYGDGTTAESATPGASWAALGQDDFSATSTSHVYAEKATVNASVTVVYTAVVTLASGASIPVTGTLNRASTTVALELFNADTVITVGDCNEHPEQPRC
ncbi:hypothetical protein [Pseudoclavibacter helvolus]|uniref:PKD domain-containing protein n=1 Tax=Pseudoclavibacter helvolus TaxID=255205 RepID=A0A7W4YEB2_9MICO|nr:hypothetical protein [Pseudoclavibacter helvolus]MBB2956313.1 hypothetical protein [Pseudoclavibacter helvolus]